MSDKIYDDCFIIMSEYGIQRMTKRPGKLARGEIAVRIRLHVPADCFDQPAISADIDVPESAIIKPQVEVQAHEAPPVAEPEEEKP